VAATSRHPGARNTKPSSPGRAAVPTDAVFTVDELAIYLKLPKRTLYKLAQEGTIPGHKVGRHWRFHRETIDAWLTRGTTLPRGKST
jgi:excisionase family DNA binding protein